MVAAPCARLQFVRGPVRNGGDVWPLNSVVRSQPMWKRRLFKPEVVYVVTRAERAVWMYVLPLPAASLALFGAPYLAQRPGVASIANLRIIGVTACLITYFAISVSLGRMLTVSNPKLTISQ